MCYSALRWGETKRNRYEGLYAQMSWQVRDEPAWYTYLIIMLLVATAICWIIFLAFALRKRKEEPQKLPPVVPVCECFGARFNEIC